MKVDMEYSTKNPYYIELVKSAYDTLLTLNHRAITGIAIVAVGQHYQGDSFV